jgi:hypothetical protein
MATRKVKVKTNHEDGSELLSAAVITTDHFSDGSCALNVCFSVGRVRVTLWANGEQNASDLVAEINRSLGAEVYFEEK